VEEWAFDLGSGADPLERNVCLASGRLEAGATKWNGLRLEWSYGLFRRCPL